MTISGIRYGVDKNNGNEYAIVFKDDNITRIVGFDKKTGEEFNLKPNTTYNIVDDKYNDEILSDIERYDETIEEVPARMEYKIVMGQNGKMESDKCDVNFIDFDEDMPSQHTESGAVFARYAFTNIEDDVIPGGLPDDKPRNNPNAPQKPSGGSVFDLLRERSNAQAPKRPANRNVAVRPKRLSPQEQQVLTLLGKYGRNLTEMAENGELDPTIARDREIEDTLQILGRRGKSSVAYVSEGGVGKTQLFKGVAQAAFDNDEDTIYFDLDLQGMGAGTKFRGDFEKKLLPILKNLRATKGMLGGKKVVLCIDEIHSQMTAGQASGGTNAGEMMKPYIADGSISVIATTTTEEYKKYIEGNSALKRRFQRMDILEPKADDTIKILMQIKHLFEDHHGVEYTEDQAKRIVEDTNRYLPALRQPDKAINIMDDAGAIAKRDGRDFITDDDISSSISKESNLDKGFVDQSDREKFVALKENLPKKVLGQDESLKQFIPPLLAAKAGLADEDRPWGVFVLSGPTGVGKTETVLSLAEELFGDRDAVTRLDMADFTEKHELSRLFGSPPGYVGHDNVDGRLTESIRDKPYSILLLDEVEKAHKSIQDKLMGFFDSGKMTDNKGREVDGRNVIVIMTTNLGADALNKKLNGEKDFGSFGNPEVDEDGDLDLKSTSLLKDLKSETESAMRSHFRPEFVGRIKALGGVINFVPLEKAVVRDLTIRKLKKVEDGMRNNPQGVKLKNTSLKFSDEFIDQLMEIGHDPKYGMRNMNGIIATDLGGPLGEFLLENIKDMTAKNKSGNVTLEFNSLKEAGSPKITVDAFNKPAAKTKDGKPKSGKRAKITIKKKRNLDNR